MSICYKMLMLEAVQVGYLQVNLCSKNFSHCRTRRPSGQVVSGAWALFRFNMNIILLRSVLMAVSVTL